MLRSIFLDLTSQLPPDTSLSSFRFREAVRVKDYFLEPVPDLGVPEANPGSSDEVYSVRLFRRADARDGRQDGAENLMGTPDSLGYLA